MWGQDPRQPFIAWGEPGTSGRCPRAARQRGVGEDAAGGTPEA